MRRIHPAMLVIAISTLTLSFFNSCNGNSGSGSNKQATAPADASAVPPSSSAAAPPMVGAGAPQPGSIPTFDTLVVNIFAIDKDNIPATAGGITIYNGWDQTSQNFQFVIANPSGPSSSNPCPAPNYHNPSFNYLKDNCPRACDINADLIPNLQTPGNIVKYSTQSPVVSSLINNYNSLMQGRIKVAALSLNINFLQQMIQTPGTQYIIITLINNGSSLSANYQGFDKSKNSTKTLSDANPVYFTQVSPS